MKISCNKLKSHIKESNKIDWIKVWDKFAIRTAEVENIEIKGEDLKGVVVVEITKCEEHATKSNYHVLEVSDGKENYSILCGAPNVKKGLKAFLVKVGGSVQGFEIAEKKIAGVLSQGMLCAGDELGINDDHDGIIELPDNIVLGTDIHDVYPINDIIIEIDNKSLTNRPDLWGHYGIAREIAAITENELLPLETIDVINDKGELDIKIKNENTCFRYCGITIDNIKNNVTPMEMQIFLKYVGLRSISLLVDLTNYVMLEIGQPMHAFDKRIVKNIEVDMSKSGEEFTTLDNIVRKLNDEVLLIKNSNEIFGLAGIMGGLESEILEDTTSIFLESATFDATTIRKAATFLGHRTDASIRYEKSLDPEMCDFAIKRFIYLLKMTNENIEITSNLTDIYVKKYGKIKVSLKKEKLKKYLGFEIDEKIVCKILTSLNFACISNVDEYIVEVPSNRATKDISMDADIIEEISRMYGYENIEEQPLRVDSTFTILENINEEEFKVKSFLTKKYNSSEVHSYLWYESTFLKECNIEKENVKIINKTDNNILRDDLSLALLPMIKNNFKNFNEVNIYEIGTVIKNNENKRVLSIIGGCPENNAEKFYEKHKKIVVELFKTLKGKSVRFELSECESYYNKDYSLNIIVDNEVYGKINVVNSKISYILGKKKFVVTIDIDFDKYLNLDKENKFIKELSKYQETELDYTILMNKNKNYSDLEKILSSYQHDLIVNYKLIGIYETNEFNKYQIRILANSKEKTLDATDLSNIQTTFIQYIENNNLEILR